MSLGRRRGLLLSARGAPLVALFSGVVLSFSPLIFRIATCTEWQYLLLRLLGANLSASIGLALARCRHGQRTLALLLSWKVALAGVLMSVANVSFILALARIDSASAILMQGFSPIVAALLGRCIKPKERVDVHSAASILLALGGLALMGTTWGADDPWGLLAAACIPLGLGSYTTLVRRMAEAEKDAWAPLWWAGVFGAAPAAVVCAVNGELTTIAARDVALALSAGCLVLGVGLAIFNYAASVLAPARASLLINSELVLAPLWTWLFLGETPQLRTCLGGLLVLLALGWLVTHPPEARVDEPKLFVGAAGSRRCWSRRAATDPCTGPAAAGAPSAEMASSPQPLPLEAV